MQCNKSVDFLGAGPFMSAVKCVHKCISVRLTGVFLQPGGCITYKCCCRGEKGGGVRAGSFALVTCGAARAARGGVLRRGNCLTDWLGCVSLSHIWNSSCRQEGVERSTSSEILSPTLLHFTGFFIYNFAFFVSWIYPGFVFTLLF